MREGDLGSGMATCGAVLNRFGIPPGPPLCIPAALVDFRLPSGLPGYLPPNSFRSDCFQPSTPSLFLGKATQLAWSSISPAYAVLTTPTVEVIQLRKSRGIFGGKKKSDNIVNVTADASVVIHAIDEEQGRQQVISVDVIQAAGVRLLHGGALLGVVRQSICASALRGRIRMGTDRAACVCSGVSKGARDAQQARRRRRSG